ncbi:MAG: hypothetical protein NVS4B11_38220 [Ktedonobacteraceae bacterium]
MRMRWWQSIRWRLALGSMLVALLATTFLALAAIVAISYYYGNDQQARLQTLASDSAQTIGEKYGPHYGLGRSARDTFLRRGTSGIIRTGQGEEYLVVVYSLYAHNLYTQPAYPVFHPTTTAQALVVKNSPVAAVIRSIAAAPLNNSDNGYTKLHKGIIQALQQGLPTIGEIGQSSIGLPPRSFIVQPITANGPNGTPQHVGALVIVPRYSAENTVPLFVATVGQAVLIASILIAVIAAIAAIIFSRTITRPLAKLTRASRIMASGDYNAQVALNTYGEIGELSHSFNEMAAQLSRDVDELRQQELWRRELIMSITHDLATPLTAIAGLGESLVDGVTQSREEYEATGRIIVRETLRLRRLVKDLHVMAKVEAGALQPQRKELRLAALVDEVLAVLAPEFERADIEPCNTIPYTLPTVQADADMLTRVFSNLCDNAIRHTLAGGSVTIEAVPHESTLVVSISDTGEGIPLEAVAHVFERFYRADSARQSTTGGSGLGLAIVRAIVETHGGKVWAENNPNSGARIMFTLPIEEVSTQVTQPMHVV